MPDLPLTQPPHRPAVNVRSVLLGLVGTILICAVTPYNDYALNNTFLVGNNLPLGVVLMTFFVVLCINGPLSRWAPRYTFSTGELCVALSMTLVACCLPSSGLMRYWPASLVGPFEQAGFRVEWRKVLLKLNLPDWIYPTFASQREEHRFSDPIVSGFLRRWNEDGPPPYSAWLRPALTWGVFIFALYGALACMIAIVRRQWVDNERLPFPLAQIQLALIEQPERGQWRNALMRRTSFWIAFGAVFVIHGWNGLSKYDPTHFTAIPVYYDLHDLFTEPPWKYVDSKIKDAAVFFTVVGVTYFLSTPVGFSLWAFYILHQFYRVSLGELGTGETEMPGAKDQHFGGLVAFTLAFLWVGRSHWMLVARQAFRGWRAGEPQGSYLPYPVAFWGLLLCTITMIAWLTLAGCTVFGAMVMTLLLLLLFLIITRIIAEAGLVHGQLQVGICKPWSWAVAEGFSKPVPTETFYIGSLLQAVHYDFREPMPVYTSHAMRIADSAIEDRKQGRRFFLCLGLALFVGYWVALGSTLWTEYTYYFTQDIKAIAPINEWGSEDNPRWNIIEPTVQYDRERFPVSHSIAGHWLFGFFFTLALSILRLRFTSWPLHPIGYLMIGTYPGAHLWLSIFVGWVAKVLIVRFGGSSLYTAAKPFFIGLIVGESIAAGFWLIMGIVLSSIGMEYRPVHIMPG